MSGFITKGAKDFNKVLVHVVPKASQQSQDQGQNQDDLLFESGGVEGADGQGSVDPPKIILNQSALDAAIELGGIVTSESLFSKNPEEKDFLINTGFEQSKPVVILSTEFLPLVGSVETSARDYALNVKEKSEVMTALNAFSVLSQNEQTAKLLKDNKDALIKFSKDQSVRIKSLIQILNSSILALNVKKFSHVPKTLPNKEAKQQPQQNNSGGGLFQQANVLSSIYASTGVLPEFKSMEDYLYIAGWGDEAKKLSPTALYQQFILELKRSLLTHSPFLLTDPTTHGKATPLTNAYKSAYELRSLFEISSQLEKFVGDYKGATKYSPGNLKPISESDKNSDDLKLYNRAYLLVVAGNEQPSVKSMTVPESGNNADTITGADGSKIITQYNLAFARGKNAPGGYQDAYTRFFNKASMDTTAKVSNLNLDVRDPVVVATLISKEISYSTAITNPDFVTNLSTRGFSVQFGGGLGTGGADAANVKVWNYIIGSNFVKDVLDMTSVSDSQARLIGAANPDPTLLGLSRTKYQLGGDNQNKYSILTFETNNMPLVDESFHNLTHGAYFYIDSALNTTNFENFDTSRLDSLILDLEKANDSCHLIKKMYTGLPKSADKSIYDLLKDRQGAQPDSIEKLVNLISSIFDIYKKFSVVSSAGKVQLSPAKRAQSFYIKDQGLLPDAAAITTATIFKLAASSTAIKATDFKKGAHLSLRLCLFHILMREVRKVLDANYAVDYIANFSAFSEFTAAKSEQVGVELDNDDDTATPDVNVLVWTDAKYAGESLSDFYSFVVKAVVGEQFDFIQTPEQAVDALLIYLTNHNGAVASIESTSSGQAYIPLSEIANIGKGSITIAEGEIEDPEMAAAAVKEGSFVEDQTLAGTETDLMWSSGEKGKGYNAADDQVSAGDDPTVLAMLGSPESYLGKLGTGTSSEPQGLFLTLRDLLVDLVTIPMFDASAPNIDAALVSSPADMARTNYSKLSNGELCWIYFNLVCEFFAMTVPDSFDGTFSTKTNADIRVGGYKLKLLQAELDEKFSVQGDTFISQFIDDFSKRYFSEQIRQANSIDVLDKFVKNALNKIKSFRDNLTSNFDDYLAESKSVLDSDPNLNPVQRVALANMSFSREQLVLSDYVLSEMLDRFDSKNESESKLRTLPEFKNFPGPFIDYAPFNDLDLTSYTTLSPFFKTFEGFIKEKSNNARILSIGMPPRMLRNLIGEPSGYEIENADRARSNVVRVKVYKNDVLNPGIVFAPIEYLFEINRFPTRIVSNWDSLLNFDGLDFRKIPTKYWDGSQIVIHKNFDQAYSTYGNFLSDFERRSIYVNHVYSQIIEEYINWFTGNRVDETRYTRYSGMADYLNNQVKQYLNYLKTTGNKFDLQNVYSEPANVSTLGENTDKIIQNLENTVKRYLNNETLLMDINDYKRKIMYPKKFDRVFNVVFDPDSFKIITFADEKTKNKYVNAGLVSAVDQSLWIRNTQQSDIYLEEYWATIEPYDITNEI